jgi:hypothetical protein
VAVDNSASVFFPPIGDQQIPSCAAWAACYVWTSYTQARDENVDISGTWLPRDPPCPGAYNADGSWNQAGFQACANATNSRWTPPRPSSPLEHIASPAFLYPLINHGVNKGTWFSAGQVMAYLNRVGCASWAAQPYDPWLDSSQFVWPTEAQWIDALRNRTLETRRLDLTEPGRLDDLKQLLANGDIAVTGGVLYQNWFNFWSPSCQSPTAVDRCPGIDNDVYYASALTRHGGHVVTIVGYDDDRTYTGSDGREHRGALLIANSASDQWGTANTAGTSRGYIWIAYDYVTSASVAGDMFDVAVWNTDRPGYRPRLYAASGISATDRLSVTFGGGTGFTTAPRYVAPDPIPRSWLTFAKRPIDPSKRVVVDLTDGLSTVDFAKPFVPLFVGLSECSAYGGDGCGASLQDTTFFYDPDGDGVSVYSAASPDPAKALLNTRPAARACTLVPPSGDVDDNKAVDRRDVQLIVGAAGRESDCASDPRDLDRNGIISVIDARLDVLRCTRPACTP